MRSKLINIKLSAQLLRKIDEAATANLSSRSSFIRESVVMRLNNQHVVHNPGIEDTLELLRQAGKQTGI